MAIPSIEIICVKLEELFQVKDVQAMLSGGILGAATQKAS